MNRSAMVKRIRSQLENRPCSLLCRSLQLSLETRTVCPTSPTPTSWASCCWRCTPYRQVRTGFGRGFQLEKTFSNQVFSTLVFNSIVEKQVRKQVFNLMGVLQPYQGERDNEVQFLMFLPSLSRPPLDRGNPSRSVLQHKDRERSHAQRSVSNVVSSPFYFIFLCTFLIVVVNFVFQCLFICSGFMVDVCYSLFLFSFSV